jgi:hypothetical protein
LGFDDAGEDGEEILDGRLQIAANCESHAVIGKLNLLWANRLSKSQAPAQHSAIFTSLFLNTF